jgi:hypothetical protein
MKSMRAIQRAKALAAKNYQRKKIFAKHGVCILSHILKLDLLSYNKIGRFKKTVVKKWTQY